MYTYVYVERQYSMTNNLYEFDLNTPIKYNYQYIRCILQHLYVVIQHMSKDKIMMIIIRILLGFTLDYTLDNRWILPLV